MSAFNGTTGREATTLPAHVIVPLLIALVLVTISTLTGNVLVCLAVLLVRKLRQPGNLLLVSLAVADFCVALLVVPLAFAHAVVGRWVWPTWLCDLWTSADVLLCTASILNLCAISLDRYWAITAPLTYAASGRTSKRMLIYIVILWALAFLISVIPLFIFHRSPAPGVCQVSQNIFYQVYATLGSFYVPTAIMLVVNYKIYRAARRLTRLDQSTSASVAFNLNSAGLMAVEIANDAHRSDQAQGLLNDETTNHKPGSGTSYEQALNTAPDIDDTDSSLAGDAQLTNNCHYQSNPHWVPLPPMAPPLPLGPKPSVDGNAVVLSNCNVGNGPKRMNSEIRRTRASFKEEAPTMIAATVKQQSFPSSSISFMHRLASVISWKGHGMRGSEGKAMKTLALIMGAFITCWLPFFILALAKPLLCAQQQQGCRFSVPPWLDVTVLWLGYFNSFLNPLIYAKYNRDFRIPFREMLCCRFGTLQTVLRNEEFCDMYGPPPASAVRRALHTHLRSTAAPTTHSSSNN